MKLKDGKEVVVRELNKEDAEEVIAYLNEVAGETDFLSFGENEFNLTVKEEEDFIHGMNESESALLLGVFDEGRMIACCSVNGVMAFKKRYSHRATLGITIRKEYWNLGLGRQLMEQLIGFVRNHPVLNMIELEVSTDNERGIHLYQSLGFQIIGEYQRFFLVDDNYCNAYYMQLDLLDKK